MELDVEIEVELVTVRTIEEVEPRPLVFHGIITASLHWASMLPIYKTFMMPSKPLVVKILF
jgi:hypothetical protein